jgi:N-succinyl-L-ornithine transcarbamylase
LKNFISVTDVANVNNLVKDALVLKKDPFAFQHLGKNKTLGLIFLNPSLRTRLSTQKAALNLGMHVIVLNINEEGWKLEMNDGAVMNGNTVEHIKDAAAIMGIYCDVIGLRCFPELKSKEADYGEHILNKFLQHCNKPIVSLESATLHPLQSFADCITIYENWDFAKGKPKVVLTWAPHIKALPQAVPNSFAQWMTNYEVDFTIAHPKGYELNTKFITGATIQHNQNEAIKNADFIYVKNWSSYEDYGAMPLVQDNWLLTHEKLAITNNAKIMHCLPVRRNVEVMDSVLDGPTSLILKQAENRVYAAQAVLQKILENN